MRIPDPKANTTTEAYLAYKAGYLEESELKPVLYEPYLHFDAWLAYWAGLTTDYPHGIGKNLASGSSKFSNNAYRIYFADQKIMPKTFTVSFTCPAVGDTYTNVLIYYDSSRNTGGLMTVDLSEGDKISFTITLNNEQWNNLRNGEGGFIQMYRTGAWTTSPSSLDDAQIEEGSTATDYEPYAKTPEMLTDEEALVAYLSGVTNTYPEEIKDPYDVRIVGYLKYLVSARWGRPEYPVNNEEFYLSTMKPPVVPSGDTPSSDIEMDDTAEAPFIDLKMYGDTYQQTYSGANLFNFRDTNSVGEGTTVSDDGFISQSKDNSSGTSSAFNNYFTHNLALDTSTTYTIVVEVQAVSGTGSLVPVGSHGTAQSTIQLEYLFSDLHAGDIIVGQFKTKSSYSGDNGLRGYTRYGAGESGSITYRISVLADTSVTPETFVYQPYTGGIPAPNPDYPQDIDVVTGRQVVGVKGKNLFYGSNNTSGGIASVWEGSKVTLEGTTTSSYANITGIDPIPTVFEAGTYTFSTDTVTNEYSKVIRIREDGQNYDYTIPKGDKSITFTTSGSFTVRICFISGFSQNVGISDTFGLQLELGSEPTAYSPYGGANYEINLGKNIVRFTSDNLIQNIGSIGTADMTFGDNYVEFVSIVDVQAVQYAYYCTPELKPENTYTISFDIEKVYGLSNNRFAFAYSDDGSSWSANANVDTTLDTGESSSVVRTFTGHKYYRFGFYNCTNSGTEKGTHSIFKNIQFELGDTATPYSPYFEPIELCKIGNYQDYIYRDGDGGWYLHKETGKIVFDGSENWQRNDANEVFTLADAVPYSVDGTAPYSNYFKGQDNVSSYARIDNNSIGFLVSSSNNRTVVKYSSETSASGFKTWLSTHNTIVYYPLATQTDTQITNSELITQLDALMEGGSYEGKTYIKVTATEPNLPGLLYVEAGKYD